MFTLPLGTSDVTHFLLNLVALIVAGMFIYCLIRIGDALQRIGNAAVDTRNTLTEIQNEFVETRIAREDLMEQLEAEAAEYEAATLPLDFSPEGINDTVQTFLDELMDATGGFSALLSVIGPEIEGDDEDEADDELDLSDEADETNETAATDAPATANTGYAATTEVAPIVPTTSELPDETAEAAVATPVVDTEPATGTADVPAAATEETLSVGNLWGTDDFEPQTEEERQAVYNDLIARGYSDAEARETAWPSATVNRGPDDAALMNY